MSISQEGSDSFLQLEFAAESSDYDHFHPDFRDLVQRLNFVESYEAQEWHKICTGGSHEDDDHYGYCLLHYVRENYENIDDYGITLRDNYRLDTVYGISLSIADIHYQSGHYASCQRELERLAEVMRLAESEHVLDINILRQHARNMGESSGDYDDRTDVGRVYFPSLPELTLPVLAKNRGIEETPHMFAIRKRLVSLSKNMKTLPPESAVTEMQQSEYDLAKELYFTMLNDQVHEKNGGEIYEFYRLSHGRDLMKSLVYYQAGDFGTAELSLAQTVINMQATADWQDEQLLSAINTSISHP